MFLYLPVEQSLRSAHLGAYRSFGIAAFECTVQGNRQVAFLPDVSPDESAVIVCRKKISPRKNPGAGFFASLQQFLVQV